MARERNDRISDLIAAGVDPITAIQCVDATDAIAAAKKAVSEREATSSEEKETHHEEVEMPEAQKHEEHEGFVSYYDAGSGVYLAWNADFPRTFHIISQDNRRTLGEVPTEARTIEAADEEIRRLINTPGKDYGVIAGLWDGLEADEEEAETPSAPRPQEIAALIRDLLDRMYEANTDEEAESNAAAEAEAQRVLGALEAHNNRVWEVWRSLDEKITEVNNAGYPTSALTDDMDRLGALLGIWEEV